MYPPRMLRNNRSMPHMSEMMLSELIGTKMMANEMMTDMYMDIAIKEHNNPEPSAAQEREASKNTLLDLAKKLQDQVSRLENGLKEVDTDRDLSATMRTAAGLRISELRRAADPLVEILSKEEPGETEDVGAGETVEQLCNVSAGQSRSE